MSVIKLLLSTRGRAERGQLWLIVAILGAGSFLIGGLALVLTWAFGAESMRLDLGLITVAVDGPKARFDVSPWVALLLLPLAVRRLHDRNRSGWRLVAFVLAYFAVDLTAEWAGPVGTAAAALPDAPPWTEAAAESVQIVAELATPVLAAWCFVEIACMPGTRGGNDYGPDPRMAKSGRTQARPTSTTLFPRRFTPRDRPLDGSVGLKPGRVTLPSLTGDDP